MGRVLVFCLLLMGSSWMIPDVWACEDGTPLPRSVAIRLIHDADAALSSNQPKRALELLSPAPGGHGWFVVHDEKLQGRLAQLWAMAAVRAGGTGELAEATARLREQMKQHPSDPVLRAHLAEALSRTKSGAQDARRLLEELAAQDKLQDAEGFAALARLRKANGETAAADQAVGRCRAMAKDPSICSAESLLPLRKTPRWKPWDCDAL